MDPTLYLVWCNRWARAMAVVGLVLGLRLGFSAGGATGSADSNLTTVDTRTGGFRTVTGRVRHAETDANLADVRVEFAGQQTVTLGDGRFSFSGAPLTADSVVSASKPGFMTAYHTVTAPPGALLVTLSDLSLVPQAAAGVPVVTGIEPNLDGLFLAGVRVLNTYTATVNWNGSTPQEVRFYANETLVATVAGPGPAYRVDVDVAADFPPSLRLGANQLRVVATSSDGTSSASMACRVSVLPLPFGLDRLSAQHPFTLYDERHLGVDFKLPLNPASAVYRFPFLGKLGVESAAAISVDYELGSGEWEAQVGSGADFDAHRPRRSATFPGLAQEPSMKLYLGNKEAEFQVYAKSEGHASATTGWIWDEVAGGISLDAKFELTRQGLADLMTSAFSSTLSEVPGFEQFLRNASVSIWAKPKFDGSAVFTPAPEWAFKRFEVTGKIGIEASYESKFTENLKLRMYVGGEPNVTFQYPGDLLKEARFQIYAGIEAEAYFFTFGPQEMALVNWSYPGSPVFARLQQPGTSTRAEADSTRLISRGYLANGGERFLVGDDGRAGLAGGLAMDLEGFRNLGHRSERPAQPQALDGAPVGSFQANLTLLENVYPASDPALAARGHDLMLLYVADNGTSHNLQFTDIRWTRFDGTHWSAPATLHTNSQAEFAPQVVYDGNGDALALWERVADPDFTQANLSAMAAQMEIVWAKWNHLSGAWSTPVPLTSNTHLDHAPLLCGPLADGSVLATWTANDANLLMGTIGFGSQVFWTQWKPGTQNWTPPQLLIADLPYRLSQSLSGAGNHAVYAWTRDLDGSLATGGDQQVFYRVWTNGNWEASKRFTSDAKGNRNARVAVAPDGHDYLVWQSGTNMVLSRDFSTNVTLVRADSQTAGFADYAITIGPAGNLALLWQEVSAAGSDAHYRILDPNSSTWSQDATLFNDSPLERSFAPVWDDVGNLTVAYNKVDIIHTNKTVPLDGGGLVTITNVPQSGRVDLQVTKRRLIQDLEVRAGDLTVSADNFLPGAAVTLSVTLRNVGDLAVLNPAVAFYDGDPATGSVLITNVTVSGWMDSGATHAVRVLWVVPEPGSRHFLYAVADPANVIREFDEGNNRQSISIGGPDLAVSLLDYRVQPSGAMRVMAQVRNVGAPTATNSMLVLRRLGQASQLSSVTVPALESGRLAQIALDVPAGTVPEGDSHWVLVADDGQVVADVDRSNNTTRFAVSYFLDTDGDGMPDQWERENSLNPNNPADAAADTDGDGVSNLAEYRAGTDPGDARSYLKLGPLSLSDTAGSVRITWGSVPNKLYTLLRSTAVDTGWTPIVEHVLSTPPENVFREPSPPDAAVYFYRLRVE